MLGHPDSTQINGGSSMVNGNSLVRFIKPNVTEISDLMPSEAEIDPSIDQIEPPQFFLHSYNADGVLCKEIPLKKYVPVYVGRAIGCLIDLVEPSISRRHCVFQYKDLITDNLGNVASGFMIYDLKSSHGTFLNGQRIPSMENIKLNHGDKIKLGQCMTIFTFFDSHFVEEQQQQQQQQQLQESQSTATTAAEVQIPVILEVDAHESSLHQQPSSTSQTVDHDTSLDESDMISSNSWLQKYINILNQLADSAKEYEEYGVPVPNFDMESRLSKRLKYEHTKLVQQAQIVAELLAAIGTDEYMDEEPEPIKPRKRRKERSSDEEICSRKRILSDSEDLEEEFNGFPSPVPPPQKKNPTREIMNDDDDEEEEEENLGLEKNNSELFSETQTANHDDGRNSNDDILIAYEQDPLAIPMGPKVEEIYEEEMDQNEIQEYIEQTPPRRKTSSSSQKKKKDTTLNSPKTPSLPPTPPKLVSNNKLQNSKKRNINNNNRSKSTKKVKEVKENKKSSANKKGKTEKAQNKRNSRKVVKNHEKEEEQQTSTISKRSTNRLIVSPVVENSTPLKPINGTGSTQKRGRPKGSKSSRNSRTSAASRKSNDSFNSFLNPPFNQTISIGSKTLTIKQPIVLVQRLNIIKEPQISNGICFQ